VTTGLGSNAIPSIDFYFSLDVEIENSAFEQYCEQMIRMEYINTAPIAKVSVILCGMITNDSKIDACNKRRKFSRKTSEIFGNS
jgi:hypothetical protein